MLKLVVNPISSTTPTSSSSTLSSSLGNMFTVHKPELCFPSSTSPLSTPLPSLACQIDVPEPHPDYHLVLSSMRAQRTSSKSVLLSQDIMTIDSAPKLTSQKSTSKSPSSPLSSNEKQGSTSNNTNNTVLPAAVAKRSNYGLLSPQSLFEMSFTKPAKIFRTNRHKIISNKYATAADVRGYIPVYEYEVNRSTILIDSENSYVLLTSICKALGPWRTDVVRQVEQIPELESLCRKIRGGFLKIQGTWVPFKLAFEICKRLAWNICQDLIPIFGFDFPEKCLSPLDVGYGELRILTNGRKTMNRNKTSATSMTTNNVSISNTALPSPTSFNTTKNNPSNIAIKNVENGKKSFIPMQLANTNTTPTNNVSQTFNPNKSIRTTNNTAAPFTSRVILRQHPYAVRSKLAFLANRSVNVSQQQTHNLKQQDLVSHQRGSIQTAVVGSTCQ